MRRSIMTLVLVAISTSAALAQESGFSYASDPFSVEKTGVANTAAEIEAGEDATSFESFKAASSQSLVQRKAAYKAEQRQLRMSTRSWYGLSKSRPEVYANPYMTSYAPYWVGRSWSPYRTWHTSWY